VDCFTCEQISNGDYINCYPESKWLVQTSHGNYLPSGTTYQWLKIRNTPDQFGYFPKIVSDDDYELWKERNGTCSISANYNEQGIKIKEGTVLVGSGLACLVEGNENMFEPIKASFYLNPESPPTCQDIPEKPCEQAIWISYPDCEWDTTECQQIFPFEIILAIIIFIIFVGVAIWIIKR
jgi:hypothetical protein